MKAAPAQSSRKERREAGPERGAKGPLPFALRTAIYRSLKTWEELRQASERDRLILPEHPEGDGGRPPTAELTEREARREGPEIEIYSSK